ncbi:MAG TPA: MCE family protein, partial [Egibacteraceae bacterium]|nr:MCE family protein [Egibacteraceae bacterium]
MNLGSRTTANLIAVALASAALIVYALAQLLTGALLDDSYPLKVRVPATGGLIPQQQATLSGVPVGLVTDFTLVDDEVEIELAIDEGRRIPRDVDVVILRRSAVGEQAIDFRPREGAGEDYFEPGDVVEPGSVVTPVEVQRLLTLADEVFSPVDPENAGKLVSEMADIVRGRRDDIRSMISDSAEFSADIADNGQDYDRLFAEGRKVTASLARNREALASSIGDMADAAAVLSDMRSDFEGLLADAPPMLASVTDVMQRGDANLSCVITSLAGINEYMAQPRQMRETENALRFNRWFFGAYEVIVQKDHAGRTWNRIQFIPPQQPPAGSYLPDKRPIPDILPGGACSSPFGDGAPAAHQADYRKTVPEARIVRPQDDRAEPVRSAGYDSTLVGARRPGGGDTGATGTSPGAGGAATGEAGTDVAQAGDASSPPSGRLPLTGLGAAT